jgi:hypothetical protein
VALRLVFAVAVVLGAAVVTEIELASLLEMALFLGPALALLGCLIARRYPGERRVLERLSVVRYDRVPEILEPGRARTLPRGGLLIACALAVRPPPRVELLRSAS